MKKNFFSVVFSWSYLQVFKKPIYLFIYWLSRYIVPYLKNFDK